MSHTDRIVLLVDMDCFYCQVEENLNPRIKGKPVAVVQYNAWQGGGIIAVNYPARAKGVKRHMRGKQAKKECPELILVHVPSVRGKADLTKYRDAGKRVAAVLQTFTPLLERASVDEAYLDITESVKNKYQNGAKITPDQLQNTHITGYDSVNEFLAHIYEDDTMNESDVKLAWGGVIAEELRAAVYEQTGYRCSAGIAHNKILAKLVAGLHKPNQQTILPQESISILYRDIPVGKITGLGGKFGDMISEKLDVEYMAELDRFTVKDYLKHFDEKTSRWLYNIARGINLDPVTIRLISKSIACCKKFPGPSALKKQEDVIHWIEELAEEISERLEKDLEENNRKAKQMVVSFSQKIGRKVTASSRTHVLNSYDSKKIASDALEVVNKHCLRSDKTYHITFLGVSVGKFEDNKNVGSIMDFFKSCGRKSDSSLNEVEEGTFLETETDVLIPDGEEEISDESKDSITEEIVPEHTVSLNVSSFFDNYLKKIESPSKRDFNTSLSLDNNFNKGIDDIINEEFEEINRETSLVEIQNNPSTSIFEMARQTNINYEFNLGTTECSECKKRILDTDLASHMDYHFALKIVRDEADLYKPKKVEKSDQKKTPPNRSVKRKANNVASCQKLTQFLRKEVDSDVPKELCEECNKNIPLNEFACHTDYHIAKKLHIEMNRENNDVGKTATVMKPTKLKASGSGSSSKKGPNNSISSYFKPI